MAVSETAWLKDVLVYMQHHTRAGCEFDAVHDIAAHCAVKENDEVRNIVPMTSYTFAVLAHWVRTRAAWEARGVHALDATASLTAARTSLDRMALAPEHMVHMYVHWPDSYAGEREVFERVVHPALGQLWLCRTGAEDAYVALSEAGLGIRKLSTWARVLLACVQRVLAKPALDVGWEGQIMFMASTMRVTEAAWTKVRKPDTRTAECFPIIVAYTGAGLTPDAWARSGSYMPPCECVGAYCIDARGLLYGKKH